MDVDQCRATVFLHDTLRRSFATWSGADEVASMQRCSLEHGHGGAHVAVPDAAPRGSFRWDECGVHIESAERRADGEPARFGGPRPAEPDVAAMSAPSTGESTRRSTRGRHAADGKASAGEPDMQEPTQALWALIAAVDRLTHVISNACDRSNSHGRHEQAHHPTAADA